MEDSVDIVIREAKKLKAELDKCDGQPWYLVRGAYNLTIGINLFLKAAKAMFKVEKWPLNDDNGI